VKQIKIVPRISRRRKAHIRIIEHHVVSQKKDKERKDTDTQQGRYEP
jgi:hypothetical protein